MLENNQNPVTEVSEQGAVQATVENVNNGMIPQGSATPDSNSSINAVVPNGTASSGTLLSGTVLQNSYLKMWDGEPLSEGKLYHRNEMIGLPECSIMENRDFLGRAEEWQNKCREVGMAQPGKYVRARIVKQAGYTPALFNKEKGEWERVSGDLLDRYYCRMDGHGRAAGHDLELAEAIKIRLISLSISSSFLRIFVIRIYSGNSLSPLTSTRRRRPMPNLRVMLLRYIRMRIHNITMTCSRPVMLPKLPHIMRMPRNLPGMT